MTSLFTLPMLLFVNFIGIIISMLTLLIVGSFTIFRINIMNNKVKFNKNKYDLPEVGETVVVKKDFY